MLSHRTCIHRILQGSLATWAYGSELSSGTHPPSQEVDYFSSYAGHRVWQETRCGSVIQQNQNLVLQMTGFTCLMVGFKKCIESRGLLAESYALCGLNMLKEMGFTVKPWYNH